MSNRLNKHLKRTSNIYCASLYPNFNYNSNLENRYILVSGECITRKMTEEELEQFRINKLERILYNK
jgi:hypothetical protein